jgi:hypothetical protein
MKSVKKLDRPLQIPLLEFEPHERMSVIDTTSIKSILFDTITPHLTLENYQPSQIIHSKKAILIKTVLAIGGLLGRVPLIPLSTRFHPEVPFLGACFAATNFISYSAYLVWATSKMTNELSVSFHISESSTLHPQETLRKASLLAFNIINGCVAQVPYLILSWDYNKSQAFMVGFNALDVTLPIYSLQMMTTQHNFLCKKSLLLSKVLSLKTCVISKIQERVNQLIKDDPNAAIQFLQDCDKSSTSYDRVEKLLCFILSNKEAETTVSLPSKSEKIKKTTAQALGLGLLGIQLAWFSLLCTQGVKIITPNPVAISAACIYVIICNIALTHFVLIGSSYQAIHGLQKTCQKKPFTYISERLIPHYSLAAKVFSVFISITALIPAAQMSKDYLPESLFWPSTLGYGLGFVFMDYYPLRVLSEEALKLGISYLGTKEQKQILFSCNQIERMKHLFEYSSPVSFAKLLYKFHYLEQVQKALQESDLSIKDLCDFASIESLRSLESA